MADFSLVGNAVSAVCKAVSESVSDQKTEAASGTPARSPQATSFTSELRADIALNKLLLQEEANNHSEQQERINRSTVRNCN
jgi:hypothetical protein